MNFAEKADELMIQPQFCTAVWMIVNRILPIGLNVKTGTHNAESLQQIQKNPLETVEIAIAVQMMQRIIQHLSIQNDGQTLIPSALGMDRGNLIEIIVRIAMRLVVLHALQNGIHQSRTNRCPCLAHRHRKINCFTKRIGSILCILL